MSRVLLKRSLLVGATSLMIAGSAFAIGSSTGSDSGSQTTRKGDQNQRTALTQTGDDRRGEVKTRLEASNLSRCEKREAKINAILTRAATRGERQIAVFHKISERTQTFYTTKGRTVSNYDALVFEVNSKKTAAQAAVEAVKATSVSFTCDGTDPKGAAKQFKDNLKAETAALKAYKTAVKNLIVGVKSAQGTSSSTENKTKRKTEGEQQ
ncbi:MAG TPA: hypothetical protein VF272_04350 [Candidatus Saccharimonadia bacterium]